MALAGLEGNLGAGRGCGRCAANTLIPSSKIFRMMHKMQEVQEMQEMQGMSGKH